MQTISRLAWRAALALLASCVLVTAAAAQEPTAQEVSLFVKEQQGFTPGYAVGDIAVGDPGVADFRVRPGRRELLLLGTGEGATTLTIWDQKRVKRHEVHIVVRTRESVKAETDLKDLLKEFPTVEVRRLGSKLIVAGTVGTQSDKDAVERLANAGGAENVVRVVKAGSATTTTAPATGDPSTPGSPATPAAPAGAPQVEYEVELLEANIAFASGTYGRGIEPSGRSLFKERVRAAVGGEVDVTIPGVAAAAPSDASQNRKSDKNKPPPAPLTATSLRLKLRPTNLAETGEITTFVLIETNLPVEGSMDPSISRRARWELVSGTDEPFGLAGAELLAMPAVSRSPSKLPRVLETAAMIPGANRGTGYVPSYVVYYDKNRKTQLLAVFRPRLVNAPR